LRGVFVALQLFAAFFLTLFGLAELFKSSDSMERLGGALLAAIGMTFLALLAVNVKK
jgi:hypothetical protein